MLDFFKVGIERNASDVNGSIDTILGLLVGFFCVIGGLSIITLAYARSLSEPLNTHVFALFGVGLHRLHFTRWGIKLRQKLCQFCVFHLFSARRN